MITKEEYLEAKQKALQYEMENIPEFYAKVIMSPTGYEKEKQIEYFDDLNEMINFVTRIRVASELFVEDCVLITKIEYNENYLPF